MAEVTKKVNLIIPEVIAKMVDTRLGDKITLMPLATVDTTLVGQPGDTLKFPAFKYIGKAVIVNENGLVETGKLEAGTVSATVHKYAKAISITDEARLSGFGDPMGEASMQLARSIDQGIDDELFDVLNAAGVARKYVSSTITANIIADALVLYGEDLTGPKLLLTDAAGFAALRQDSTYIKASDIGQRMITDEVVGEVWGCQIIISNKIKTDATQKEKSYFIVKPGALRLVMKRGTLIEVQREAEYMRDNIFASHHVTAYLYDATSVVGITSFTGLQAVNAATAGIESTAGETTNGTFLQIPEVMAAPAGYKWVYKLDSSADDIGAWDTALTGTTDWVDTEIAASSSTKAHLVLVNATDTKPVKTTTITLVKKV